MKSSLQATEEASAAVVKAPDERVSLSSMEAKIKEKYVVNVGELLNDADSDKPLDPKSPLYLMTACFLVMDNGFVLIGKTAPASAKNFNRELGEKFAYEDAIRQLWPLEGYALREKLSQR